MEEETTARRARPRLNPFTKAERRQRIFGAAAGRLDL